MARRRSRDYRPLFRLPLFGYGCPVCGRFLTLFTVVNRWFMNRSSCSTVMPTALMVRVRRTVFPSGFSGCWPDSWDDFGSGLPGRGNGLGRGPRFFGSSLPHIHRFICSMRSTARYWSNVHARAVFSSCQTRDPSGRFTASSAAAWAEGLGRQARTLFSCPPPTGRGSGREGARAP